MFTSSWKKNEEDADSYILLNYKKLKDNVFFGNMLFFFDSASQKSLVFLFRVKVNNVERKSY